MDTFKGQIQEAIKLELSQIVSQHSAPLQPNDIEVLAARVSTNEREQIKENDRDVD